MNVPKKTVAIAAILVLVIIAGASLTLQRPIGPSQPTVTTQTGTEPTLGRRIALLGAGASFPYPLISKWAQEYEALSKGMVVVNYQSIGSGGGIKQISEGAIDFGATDAPLTPDEAKRAPGLLHIPETIGAVVLAYNLPGVGGRLKLSGDVLADIYLGKIAKWNDPRIASMNEGMALPDREMVVVKRSDSSGTTFIFTDYLSAVSGEWLRSVGRGKVFNYPEAMGARGVQAKGNEGVTAIVKQTPYSIGYVELTYALQNNIPYALIRNKAGRFIEANFETIANAASAAAPKLPKGDEPWDKVSIVDADGEGSYPIASFTYLLVYKDLSYMGRDKAQALVDFLRWAVTEGQKYCKDLYYVPLPPEVQRLNLETISMIRK
ncbi:MAG: phosphate ABC transporter substrate-binding protein PstS [Candidatus Bathyarchaeia archaeon]